MSIIPPFLSRRRSDDFYDSFPFSSDLWAPYDGMAPPLAPATAARPPPNPTASLFEVASFAQARVDWKETETEHVFQVEVPGLKKEDLKVQIEDDTKVLAITGERVRDKAEKPETWHRMERVTGKFSRRFCLPENAKTEGMSAAMEDGVLTVTIPKVVEAKNLGIRSVEISGR